MTLILKWLGGSLGPYIVGGVAVLLALSIGFGQVQSLRLKHAKADLATARAALIDPATRKTWRSEAEARARDLTTCHGNVETLTASLGRQEAAVAALKAQSAAWVAKSRKAAQDARAVAESYRQAGREILAAKPGADACLSADALILKEATR